MKPESSAETSTAPRANQILEQALARLHPVALGIAVGTCLGMALLAATLILVVKGGHNVGPMLSLLGQYFPGYSVTWSGGVVGALYAGAVGFALGWIVASLRNLLVYAYVYYIRVKRDMSSLSDYLDQP